MPPVVILSVGLDPVLLETRGKVLAVLCHSIPAEDPKRFAYLIHQRSPRTPIVFVASGVGSI
jgi:hypothetical protein